MTRFSKLALLTVSSIVLASCGGGGGSSTPPPSPPPPPPPDTTAPTVSFNPTSLTVNSGETAAVTVSATDNVAVTSGPTVSCDNGGTFSSDQFTAPATTSDITVTCTATASDAAGNQGNATLTVTVIGVPPDTEAPMVSFSPNTLTVVSGANGTSTLTATDNVAVTVGPNVTCTNGGSFSGSTFTAPSTTTDLTSVCTATAEDAAGNSGTDTLTVTVTGAPSSDVTISGKITFDFVPHNANGIGLNYNGTTQNPARGITVEALNGAGGVITSAKTDDNGDYSFTVAQNTNVRIRAKAEVVQTTGAQWDVKVTDNTNGNALYAIQGSLTSSGTSNQVRDLNADSGWGGSSYTGTRAAAPFAILDPVYTGIQKFVAVDANINFPPVEFRWSVNNRSGGQGTDAERAAGIIGTSSYVGNGSSGNVYILGNAGVDTDEYDRHVVVHEWGHYFEDRLSRSDSIGGPHSLSNRLDMRVAMGEGWGNALSAMILDDPVYKDSLDSAQSSGFLFDLENNNHTNEGWFNEGSVQSIIYDIFDSNNDGPDGLALGLGPIYETLIAPSYTGTNAFTSIFLFIDELKSQQAGSVAAIDSLLSAQNINGTDEYGAGETNNGGAATHLPVYKTVTVGGAAVSICSTDDNGEYNRLGNREFLRLNIPANATYTISMLRTSGLTGRDPDFYLFQQGVQVIESRSDSTATSNETFTGTIEAGEYIIDAHDFQNLDLVTGLTPGDACYNFSVTN